MSGVRGKKIDKDNSLCAELFRYVKKKYHIEPDYPWRRDPESAVFRHADNHKWFGLIMEVRRSKLGYRGFKKCKDCLY